MPVINYLKSLPDVMSYSLILIGILAIVVIAMKGKLIAKWGKNVIGLGTDLDKGVSESITETESTAVQGAPTTVLKIPKRSCGDCILIIMAQREKYELEMSQSENKRLKQSMTYAEQKLTDVQSLLNDIFTSALEGSKANKLSDNGNPYDMQYKMFYGLMRDSLVQVKDEIRRSLKENNFYELNEIEFSNYVKDRNRRVISMVVSYIHTIYPTSGVAVEGMSLVSDIEFNAVKFQEILFDIYMNAKKIILEVDNEIKNLKQSFSTWVDDFVK